LEEWVIKNLGLQPIVNQELNFNLDNKGAQKFKLVGIIEDIPSNKSVGMAEGIIGGLDVAQQSDMTVFIEFDEEINILNTIYDIQQKADIKDDNISINTMLLNAINKLGNIDWSLIILAIFIAIVCGIVIYGIYGISMYQRIKEYGIIRAIGGQRWQIFCLSLLELGIICLISIPIGMLIGIVGAKEFGSVFGKLFTEVDVNSMQIVFSKEVLLFSILVILLMIVLISLKTSGEILKISPIQAIKQNLSDQEPEIKKQRIIVSDLSRFIPFHMAISFKNITGNKKSLAMIILSMVLGSVLFISANYYAKLQESLSQQNFEKTMVNYDYKLVTNGTLNLNTGMDKKAVEDIKNIKGIKDVTPTKIAYSRAVIDNEDILSKEYFQYLQRSSADWETRVKESEDKSSIIIRNSIWGYTDQALAELDKSVVAGKIDIDQLKKERLAVVYVPTDFQMENKKVVDINPGDTIRITFRKDGEISEEFYDMKDEGEYVKEEFTAAAVITSLPVWDDWYSVQNGVDVIIPEEIFDEVCGFNNYRLVHANKDPKIINENISQELLDISRRTEGITVRDLSQERVELREYYDIKDSFVYLISIVLFIISMFNIANNVSYSVSVKDTVT
jgi:putative ABC transport system permease protein